MSIMLIFQGFSMWGFIGENSRRRREYAGAANEAIAASLNALGENIRGMAFYMASFEAFQNLYFPQRRQKTNPADMVSSAFQSVRFLSNYYPIIQDVIMVGLNGIPLSYYSGFGYDFMDLMRPDYDFEDPRAMESRFFYFDGEDYFVYATPVSAQFSSAGNTEKIATCVFICGLSHIRDLLKTQGSEGGIEFVVRDRTGRLIASRGAGPAAPGKAVEILSGVESMDLTVATSETGGAFAAGDEGLRFIRGFSLFSFVLAALITAAVILLLQYRVWRPVSNLVKSMSTPDDKPLHRRLAKGGIDELDHIAGSVNSLLDEIEAYLKERMATQERLYEMDLRKNEAEIYALQSQINPHFLNNTLQCIRGIAISRGVNEIAAISLAMSELFRYAMNYEERVLVREEIEMVRHFVMITNIRFRNRFVFSFDIDQEILDCTICRMTLQPLVENAVRHGVSRREDGGAVAVTGRREAGALVFEVIDNGPGFGGEELAEIERNLARSFAENRELGKGKSFGLYNIDRRLKLHYGEGSGLEIRHREGRTIARLRFPAI
jgi:signal transduction histidine kinase